MHSSIPQRFEGLRPLHAHIRGTRHCCSEERLEVFRKHHGQRHQVFSNQGQVHSIYLRRRVFRHWSRSRKRERWHVGSSCLAPDIGREIEQGQEACLRGGCHQRALGNLWPQLLCEV